MSRKGTKRNSNKLKIKKGGWNYRKKSKRGSLIPITPKSFIKTGGQCGCNKFFSKGGAFTETNVSDAKYVIPSYVPELKNDPSYPPLLQSSTFKGGNSRRKTMRRPRIRVRGGLSLFGHPNAVSSFGTSPDTYELNKSVFSTNGLVNPSVYSQSTKTSSLV